MSRFIGDAAELEARTWLIKQGLQWLTSNYFCRWGEIDLIMRDGDYLVFVEVRQRISAEFGGAVGSITPQKKRKLLKTASHYMVTKKWYDKYPVRFDVVSIQGALQHIDWIKNAFGVDF